MPIDSIDGLSPLVGPSSPTPVTGPSSTTSESEWMSTLSPSDKKLIEELAAMLPKTWIDPVLAQQLWLSMMMNLGLGAIANDSRPPTGTLENAIVLVLLGNWLNNLSHENEAIRERLQAEQMDPLTAALSAYATQVTPPGKTAGEVSMEILQVLKNSPLLASAVSSVDPMVLLKAFEKAMHSLVISMLDKFIESEAELRDQQRVASAEKEIIIQQEKSARLLADYVKAVKNGEIKLSQPTLSFILISSLSGNQVQVPIVVDAVTGKISISTAHDSMLPVVNAPVAKQVIGDAVVTKQATGDTVVTKQVAGDAVVTKQVEGDAVVTKQVTGDTVVTKQVAGDTVVTKQVAVDAVVMKQVTVDTVGTKQVAGNTTGSQLSVGADRNFVQPLPAGQTVFIDFVNHFNQDMAPKVQAALAAATAGVTQFMSDVTLTAAYWAIPGAVTLQAAQVGKEGANRPSEAAVRSYALTIAQFVLRPDFENFVKVMILRNVDLKQVAPERMQSYMASLKVVLLANALAALDKVIINGESTEGIIRAQDVVDMMSGKWPLEEGDMRFTLVKLIKEQLGLIQPESQRNYLMGRLLAYFNTNPPLERLIDPTKAFLILSDPRFTHEVSGQAIT